MSPGNSYFKDKQVAHLLREAIKRYGKAVIFVADVPAISTYLAMGYNLGKARSKAILHGNNLKNRTKRVVSELWIDENKVIIIDRDNEIKDNQNYLKYYAEVENLYKNNTAFHKEVNDTTEGVLKNSCKEYTQESVEQGTHYLLSEIAFLEYAPTFFGVEKIDYVYHKNRFIFEDYVAGKFDGKFRNYLEFVLLESPEETYVPLVTWSQDEIIPEWISSTNRFEMITKRWVIRCMFVPYFDYFKVDWVHYSGLFFEILQKMAKDNGLTMEFVEQTGYGVITQRLNVWFADVFCSPVWPTTKRRWEVFFSDSVFQSNVYAYFNANSPYSNQPLETLKESETLRIAVRENDVQDDFARLHFPNARLVRIPQLSDITEGVSFVLEGKADMTFRDEKLVDEHLKNKSIPAHTLVKKSFEEGIPLISYENCFALPWGEFELKRVLDEAIEGMEGK